MESDDLHMQSDLSGLPSFKDGKEKAGDLKRETIVNKASHWQATILINYVEPEERTFEFIANDIPNKEEIIEKFVSQYKYLTPKRHLLQLLSIQKIEKNK